ncbi:MAG: DUF4394 domain-containing protein [Parvularculaceae bacterium]
MNSLKAIAAGLAAAVSAGAGAEAATVGFALGSGGNTLLRFDLANPAGATAASLSVRLDAIDFRPATGQLFGYSSSADAYYTVDIATGIVTAVPVGAGQTVATTNGPNVDLDWNPTIDRMRAVGSSDENIVFNPNTGGAAAQVPLFYQAGDPNAGVNPLVAGNAYSNNFAGAASTQQYVLDYGLDIIATLGNNAGTLGTLGALTLNGAAFDFNSDMGFDIASDTGVDVFYALLSQGGLTALFTINVATRELTQIGAFESNLGQIRGLAVASIVPLPAGLLLFLTGGAGLGLVRRMRRRTGM